MVEVIKANMSFKLKNGHVLPNARSVSDLIHGQPQEDIEDSKNSLLGTVLNTLIREGPVCIKISQKTLQMCSIFLPEKEIQFH